MFMGEYHPVADEKGRVAVPVRLRKAFGDDISTLVLTHGFDRCIMGFRESDWKEFVETRLVPLSQSDPDNRKKVRFLLGGASVCELDRQGRLLLPSYLKDYAGIEKALAVLGVYDRIEIWSEESYLSYKPAGSCLDEFAGDLGL